MTLLRMPAALLLLLLFPLGLLRAEVIDRVALAIGNQAISESQIDEELRVTALLNHSPLVRNPAARQDAAERMIEQFLIKREAEVSRFPGPQAKDVDTYQAQIERDYGGPDNLQGALRRYELEVAVLRTHLVLQLTTLRFVAFRFQPELSANAPDRERRTDDALAAWLAEARKRFNILYLDRALEK